MSCTSENAVFKNSHHDKTQLLTMKPLLSRADTSSDTTQSFCWQLAASSYWDEVHHDIGT